MDGKAARRRALDHLPRTPSTSTDSVRPAVYSIGFYSGNRHTFTAFSYNKVVWVNYQPSRGIQIHFASHTVFVAGHDLGKVYKDIVERRLKEIGPEEAAGGPRTPGVEAVYIRQVSKNEPGFTWPSEAALAAEKDD